MITYPPNLKENAHIGVTAPSSGVPDALHHLLHEAIKRQTERGYKITVGDTAWTQQNLTSASAIKRAAEFNAMMQDHHIDIIIPPWGGERLIDILPFIEFNKFQPKWVLGYSDTSLLLLAITLHTGLATAHGTNFIDLRGTEMDETTAMWEDILKTPPGASITQMSSNHYQHEWQFDNPTPHIFHLTEKTVWKSASGQPETLEGHLLGGCIDTVKHLMGTPYGDVNKFVNNYIPSKNIIWFFENCELSLPQLHRTLIQMKLAGWFDHCNGIMFGRSSAQKVEGDYELIDLYRTLSTELAIPILYDIDCGHLPPQLTLVNGAFATIHFNNGQGIVTQSFK
ncbi:LD-carboxypeptidase [Salipaludibacillus agaradhaerens]|uniref:S66 family peptidase n=1 Tax=Salipaludibacillus agaradhaerens TaxID=76935 RepID=UPI002151580E|nr:LD-carboxypeptidase [Salipaludibacillus agaradhaerens]MCR6117685.1 LD-carboxypeptidase [Salipaludibacillus agaradhaerens]